jgi:putative inorganic carbon (HCO3(-)) transporter
MSIFGKQFTVSEAGQRAALAIILVLVIASQQYLLMSFSLTVVLGLVGMAALMIVLFLQPETATLFVVFVLYSNMSVVFKRNGLPQPVAAAAFLLLGLPLFNYVVIRREKVVGSIPFFLMIVYFAVALLSATWAGDPRQSATWITNYILEGLILYFLFINTIRTPSVLRKAIWVIIVAGAMMGGLSVYQAYTNSYNNDFGGWATVSRSQINVGQEDILGNQQAVSRVSGPIGEKNFYALILVVLLPLAISRFSAERSTMLRILALMLCVPILGGALLTYSRGAGVAAGAMIVAMFALGGLRLRYILVVGVIAAVTLAVFVPDYVGRISTISSVFELLSGNAAAAGGSVQGRATENLASLRIFTEHPILGVGPGQTRLFIQAAANDIGFRALAPQRRAHDLYLEILSDNGILGLISYLMIVFVTMYQLWSVARRFKKTRPDIFYTVTGLLVALITFQVNGVFLHLSYFRYYWFLMALAEASVLIFKSTSSEEVTAGHHERFGQSDL